MIHQHHTDESLQREGLDCSAGPIIISGRRHTKRSLMSWVVVIPKEGRAHMAALLLVWHRLFQKKVGVIPKEGPEWPHTPVLLLVWQRLKTLGTFLSNTGLDCFAGPITISGVKEQTPLTTSQINHPQQVNNSAVKRVKEHGVLQNFLSERSFINARGLENWDPGLEKNYNAPFTETWKFATPYPNLPVHWWENYLQSS